MFGVIPPELILNILSYLTVQDIQILQLVARDWYTFVQAHESSIYHAAAIVHNFVDPGVSLAIAQSIHNGPWIKGLSGWRDLCQRWFAVERNWEAKGKPPKEGALQGTKRDVHRFKLDEERRFVITTHSSGGLTVSSMDENAIIFSLSPSYVRKYSHCEYGNGYLIFDRHNPVHLEVWRLETPDLHDQLPQSPSRADFQQYAYERQTFRTINSSRLGSFKPWALLNVPTNVRAYRFVYPTLLVGSSTGKALYLFDVPTAALKQTISLASHPFFDIEDDRCRIMYVELGQRHAFVCCWNGVLIVPLDQSRGPRILEMGPTVITMAIPQLARSSAIQISSKIASRHSSLKTVILSEPRTRQTQALVSRTEVPNVFSALHVSSDGKDFAAINCHGILFLVRDFQRVERGEATFADVTVCISFESSLGCLAFEHGRIALQTRSKGIYVVNWDVSHHAVMSHPSVIPTTSFRPPLLPNITIHQLANFTSAADLDNVSCLQMTKTAVWINWSVMSLYGEVHQRGMDDDTQGQGRCTVCYVDFSPPRT